MPEWSIGAVSKTVVPLRAPRVRIPVFPHCKALTIGALLVLEQGENPRVRYREALS